MAAEKFAELVRRLHPHVSVRQLEMRAGVPRGTIGYYLKPSTQLVRMPKATAITRLAEVLGCHPTEVSKAFAASLNISWTQQLSGDEEELLVVMRSLTPAGRETLLHLGKVMRSLTPAGQETLLHLGKALMNIHGNDGLTTNGGGHQALACIDGRPLAPFRANYHSGSVPD